jgi:hypothetical protein
MRNKRVWVCLFALAVGAALVSSSLWFADDPYRALSLGHPLVLILFYAAYYGGAAIALTAVVLLVHGLAQARRP